MGGEVSVMALVWAFLKALPQLIALVRFLHGEEKKAKGSPELERTVKNDLSKVHAAFVCNDSNELNRVFNARLGARPPTEPPA